MKVVNRLDENGDLSGDFSPTCEASDILAWCKDNNYTRRIADQMILLCQEATEDARDETESMFWPTMETMPELVCAAQEFFKESEVWPPLPAALPEITFALPKEKRRWKKGQMLITKSGDLE